MVVFPVPPLPLATEMIILSTNDGNLARHQIPFHDLHPTEYHHDLHQKQDHRMGTH